jgi:hypothetical protein
LFIGGSASQPPEFLAQLPHAKHALALRDFQPELKVVAIGFGSKCVSAHGHSGAAIVGHSLQIIP